MKEHNINKIKESINITNLDKEYSKDFEFTINGGNIVLSVSKNDVREFKQELNWDELENVAIRKIEFESEDEIKTLIASLLKWNNQGCTEASLRSVKINFEYIDFE